MAGGIRRPGLLPWEYTPPNRTETWTEEPAPPPSILRSVHHLRREPPRCMYPGEFVSLIRKHRASKWLSCGVLVSRWGDRPRGDVQMDPHGTIWFADFWGNCENLFQINANCIPYTSKREAVWDEARDRLTKGDLTMGWRAALSSLVQEDYLLPSEPLFCLIGEKP